MYPDRLRLPLDFDPHRLSRDLEVLEGEGWIAHFVPQNYEGDWSVIPLRGPKGATHPVMMIYPPPGGADYEDTPFLERTPYFREVLSAFRCPVLAARLMRLAPGSVIKQHQDHDLGFESGTARVHVPITTSPEVEFLLNGTPVVMSPGSAWWLRLSDPHSVSNRGPSARVHLVVDLVADAWLGDLLDRALAA
jgi:quercetin dioxygenase-like cupin family protein